MLREQEQLIVMLIGAVGICILGALDDIHELGWMPKLLGQFGIATAVVLGSIAGPRTTALEQLILPIRRLDPPLLGPVEVPLAIGIAVVVIWIVTLMNVFNFIDGVDGLATGVAAIGAATFAIVGASYGRWDVAIVSAALAGACLGFLPWNFTAGGARVFLGDAGSMLLGYCLAVISVQGVLKTAAAVSLVIPLALAAVPLLDTAFVVSKRLKYRQPVSSADKWHLHHRLLSVGFSPRRVATTFWIWTAVMSAFALTLRFASYGNSNAWRIEGLVIVLIAGLIAVATTVFLAFKLEILKTAAVKERNRLTAEEQTAQEQPPESSSSAT
jgi:UDP-GlcNAc:undecaprenyl-phosphate GlcNAc-1-phosphate transferase